MSEDKNDKVALGTGARAAVDGDLDKMLVPARVDPNATGVTAPAPATDVAAADG